ncbi:leucine carboxyl methyltransferase [Pholiota conissans]|uniref:Leucine carboxyl methyltransferase 1 n=1 Tax=Pholiota conissans TaxID=109636 RepID=A0A9P6D7U9_9AGAR|nr:leucine carboxyl methyltransferase [Pholiota conissans]
MFPPPRAPTGDASIRSTDNDAAVARLSAVQKHYFEDPYIRHFVPRAHLVPHRPPLINIGTYVRSAGIDTLIDQWLSIAGEAGKRCQIISLGAGSDTRFWRIAAGHLTDNLKTYIEVDFPEITTKKAMAIRKSKELMSGLGDAGNVSLAQGGTALHSPRYHLLPTDLRVDPSETLEPLLCSSTNDDDPPLLDPSMPTLLLFECVLAYMPPSSSSRLLEWFVNLIKTNPDGVLGCVVYEMFGLDDAFGRVMINNLSERNITLPGVGAYPTIESLPNRFIHTGFKAARALTLKDIRKNYIASEELERISQLEFLDETEELDLVLAHYAISWGLLLINTDIGAIWGKWGLIKQD